MNELVGPILFKTALDRSGETASHGDVEEPAAPPVVDTAH